MQVQQAVAANPALLAVGRATRLAVPPLLFVAAFLVVMSHPFVRAEEFIHRGDDAYYYFKVAANFPDAGRWTFDTIHSTNGVQPLWAIILTSLAQVLKWFGISEPNTLARVFVALTALLHFGSCIVLYHLLARKVSVGTALTAAGAFLFPLGIVWARVWGMENSLYALLLLTTIAYFHLRILERSTVRRAVLLGVLLGLTALARLNAMLFIPCLLGYFILAGPRPEMMERARLAFVAGVAAAILVLPYFLANFVSTGHLLPISSAAKVIGTEHFLRQNGVESRLSAEYAWLLVQEFAGPVRWFITSRASDALWVIGGRLWWEGIPPLATFVAVMGALVLGPLALGRAREWLRFLADRFGRLAPFGYVLVFGALDATISVFQFPLQLKYAMIKWWLVENEIAVVVISATLVVACISYVGSRLLSSPARAAVALTALTLLVGLHVRQAAQFYFDDEVQLRDWNASWNDDSYLAAQWLATNTPKDARIGSWNAGVLGYYSDRRVINLDGLINNFSLLPYLQGDDIGGYIRLEHITYLSDLDPMFKLHRLNERMKLTEVYRRRDTLTGEDYRIYRVDER